MQARLGRIRIRSRPLLVDPAAELPDKGGGSGHEGAWTYAFAEGQRRSGIVVDVFVPGLAPDRQSAVGAWYCRLYALLYDEDVSVMVGRQERLDERAGSRLARTVSASDLGSVRSRSACTVAGAAPDRRDRWGP